MPEISMFLRAPFPKFMGDYPAECLEGSKVREPNSVLLLGFITRG